MKKMIFLAALAAGLGGCGGSSDTSTPPAPMPAADAFTAQVLEIASTSSDIGEAVTVDSLNPTQPEDTQPVAITGS